MNKQVKTLLAAAAIGLLATAASAGETYKRMPVDFVGDWCSDPEGTVEGGAAYVAPRRVDGKKPCTDIISIDKYGFYFFGSPSHHCYPLSVRTKEDHAPSGTAYTAKITARCHPDGPVGKGTVETYVFEEYKGQLSVKNNAD